MNTHGHTVEEWRKIRRAAEKLYRQRHPEKVRAKQLRARIKHAEKIKAAGARYRAEHPEKVAIAKKQSYARNKPHIQEYLRNYYLRNKESTKARSKQWYANNKERATKRNRAYVDALPTEVRERRMLASKPRRSAYRKKHLARYAAHRAKYRALQLRVVVNPKQIQEWETALRAGPPIPCYYCRKPISGSQIHFDHVIPVTREGAHEISNLAASCQSCNLSKNNRLIGQWNVKAGQQVLSL